jgi:lipopolysaccharide/colanic/teichoic acid biosynthesis glycosyltransferase
MTTDPDPGALADPRIGYAVTKRLFDLVLGVPLLLFAAPMILLGACAVWIVDPGPVFYRQTREGRGGRRLRMLKLRTMYRDADARLQDLLRTDPAAREEWYGRYKLRHDPRVLPVVGPMLRTSSCDELPQLWHVLTGEMSLVGPRPFPDYHLAAMPAAFRARRRTVTPGITGLWQISARSDCDLAGQQALDERYLDGCSLWLDVRIMIGTVRALARGRGAY